MSTLEVIAIIIYAIVVLIPFIGSSFLLIVVLVKCELDKGEKEGSGIWGWVIAIQIACAIFYALFFSEGCNIDHFRHT